MFFVSLKKITAMKKYLLLLLFLSFLSLEAQIPFPQYPSFETEALGHRSTGLGIADINGDGWKDIIVANGNDMARQHLVVYYNRGDGTFPSIPDWQSDDIDYHGHLAAGDIDQDGDVDIAVSVYIGAAGFSSPGRLKVYYNNGSELEGLPGFESDAFYTFSCALGDADGDGDLDLAAACGEPYSSLYQSGRIFYNENGSFNTANSWSSAVEMGALDVEFGDVDQNGFLDLIFVCQETMNFVFLADNSGMIDEQWDWVSDHPGNYMNSLDFGKPCTGSSPCFVSTGNNQLGGDGKIKQFTFTNPIPQSSPPSWESAYVGTGSGILMAEVNGDDQLDLLYGSWWGPLTILEGDCGFWMTTPAYTASQTSVVEAILMSDLGKFNYQAGSRTIKSLAEQSVIYLDEQVIESITAVYVNSVLLDPGAYCHAELKNWISFRDNIMPGDVVTIEYEAMKNGDIVISNWDSGIGNYIYYNANNPVGVHEAAENESRFSLRSLYPQPASDNLTLSLENPDKRPLLIRITDLSGKTLYRHTLSDASKHTIPCGQLADGTYILNLSDGSTHQSHRIIISR